MSTYDPTDELVRAMLARRADGPPPAWLLSSVTGRVATTRQARRAPGLQLPERWAARVALAAAAVLLLGLLAGGILAAGGWLDRRQTPEPTQPAVVVLPSASPSGAPLPSASAEVPSPTSTPRPTSASGTIAKDTLAAVTPKGVGLRVRSAPGTGKDSERYKPLLRPGARMLVLRGPVAADGMEWYQVILDEDPGFGWVAAGRDGEDWIRPAAPRCPATLDQQAAVSLSSIEFLACYGATPVSLRASSTGREADTGTEPMPCPYADTNVACEATPAWLFEPYGVTLLGDEPALGAVARPAMQKRLAEVPDVAYMTLTLAMDHPKAMDCRVQDRRGRNVIPRDEAVARCRLRLVITGVTWDEAMVLPREDDVVRVLASDLPVYKHPNGEPMGPGLAAGDEMLVGEPERQEDGVPWVPVFPRGGVGWPAGWVPFLVHDELTLERIRLDCPEPGDWSAIAGLDRGARLACFADVGRMRITVRVEPTPADPRAGACGAYLAVVPSPGPCEGSPTWLTAGAPAVGVDPDEETARVDLWFDPARIDASSIPATPTVMRLTGRFAHAGGWDCEIRDPETGEALVWAPAAQAYCRAQFVVTGMTPVP